MQDKSSGRVSRTLAVTGWIVAAIFAAMLVTDEFWRPRIGPEDIVKIQVLGTLPDMPIADNFNVSPAGKVWLGNQAYGLVDVSGLTLIEAREAIEKHLSRVLTAPEVTVELVESAGRFSPGRILPALGWIVVLTLAFLLAITTVRSYTVPEPRRKALQFSAATLLWLMVVVALAIFAFNERRERIRLEAIVGQQAADEENLDVDAN